MDAADIDRLARALKGRRDRRSLAAALAGGLIAVAGFEGAEAKRKKSGKARKKRNKASGQRRVERRACPDGRAACGGVCCTADAICDNPTAPQPVCIAAGQTGAA